MTDQQGTYGDALLEVENYRTEPVPVDVSVFLFLLMYLKSTLPQIYLLTSPQYTNFELYSLDDDKRLPGSHLISFVI